MVSPSSNLKKSVLDEIKEYMRRFLLPAAEAGGYQKTEERGGKP